MALRFQLCGRGLALPLRETCARNGVGQNILISSVLTTLLLTIAPFIFLSSIVTIIYEI